MKPMSISEIRTLKDETDWERLRNMDDSEIDYSDIPPLDEDFFRNAVFRPPRIRKMVSIRLEEHILEWFKRQGPGYQTRIQSVLKYHVLMARRAETMGRVHRQGKAAKRSKAPVRIDAPEPKLPKRVAKSSAKSPAKSSGKVSAAVTRKKSRAATASAR
jgi:uncharacterized protein (DUF4415 family)